VRQLVRRLRTCEAGSGLVEYALLIAVVALGLVGVLRFFSNTAGGLTNRVAVSVSAGTAGGYGSRGSGVAPSASPAGSSSPTADPDGASAERGSSGAAGGATAVFRIELP
jgi:Flp pilus assembly pilin Flp